MVIERGMEGIEIEYLCPWALLLPLLLRRPPLRTPLLLRYLLLPRFRLVRLRSLRIYAEQGVLVSCFILFILVIDAWMTMRKVDEGG
jgi:hypothetical protein